MARVREVLIGSQDGDHVSIKVGAEIPRAGSELILKFIATVGGDSLERVS